MNALLPSNLFVASSLRRGKAWLAAGLFLAAVPALAQTVPPAFPRNETFMGSAASNFTFGGAARLTGNGAASNDPTGQGYLRLTDAVTNQAGYVIDNVGFPSSAGFTISFEFFSYGGSGADGFSVFLVDADNQPATGFRIGASGGSLGYAQKNISPIADGVSRGYIGIGIDEFGNYSNASEGRSGGSATLDASGKVPDGIAIRGAGNGSATTDYPYLTGTRPGDLNFSLDVPTVRAQSGSADYRRAYIDVVPTTVGAVTTYRISVRIQHGQNVHTTVENFVVPTPPANLRLGFSGSTGGSTNIHEIRNLNIVQVPFATDDAVTTLYNQPATVRVLDNDVAPGSSINPASVDLDPTATGLQTTLAVPGKGSFSVDNQGVVMFTPVGSFAGTITVPYTMQSVLGANYTSSPANIRVTVSGADIVTSLTGPSSATPGTSATYSMSTNNQGGLTAANVVPTLQLPAGLAPGAVASSTGGAYDAASGLVTFPGITSLSTGSPAVTNSVTVLLPASGPANLTATAASWAATPDPETDNNTSWMATSVAAPLPVELTDFAAATTGSDVRLTWTTASEQNSSHFETERALDGRTFERVGTVLAKGTTQHATSYTFRDVDARRATSGQLYYRLRQVDTDGKATYSAVQTVRFGREQAGAAFLYPNPAAQSTTLDLSALPVGPYTVQVRDVVGRIVLTTTAAGSHQTPLAVQVLPAGTYVVQVRGEGGQANLPLVRN